MTATAIARHRIAALVLATAALGGTAAVAAASSSSAPATHSVAMYREDPTCEAQGYMDFRGTYSHCD